MIPPIPPDGILGGSLLKEWSRTSQCFYYSITVHPASLSLMKASFETMVSFSELQLGRNSNLKGK